MTAYNFATITAAQALAFDGKVDQITTSGDVRQYLVSFDDAAGTVRITDPISLHAVVFGAGFEGAVLQGDVGLLVGTPGADFIDNASLIMFGGSGNDTLLGGSFVRGGPGSDLFISTYVKHMGQILDWETGDRLYMSTVAATDANYVEATQSDALSADNYANTQMFQGKEYVVVAVGQDLRVYANYLGGPGGGAGAPTSTTLIVGRSLADISSANFQGGTLPVAPGQPPTITGAGAIIAGNMDNFHLSSLVGVDIANASPNQLVLHGGGIDLTLQGTGFTYDGNEQITGGTVGAITYSFGAQSLSIDVHAVGLSAASFGVWVATDATATAFSTIFAGADAITGSTGADLLRGYAGGDILSGSGGADTIFGGTGDDFIYAGLAPSRSGALGVGDTYLRGDEGDDNITGGQTFDDMNGNMGNDTVHGGAGNDYSVGGKDNDMLFGDAGDDIVWGNLGNDTCDGGDGNDQVRGGQGNDVVLGGAGDDFVSGDRGDDTITGGAGADNFHGSQDAGVDRVLDFNPSEGDRVQLDPGTTYTLKQVGLDAVLDMGNGNQMILVGVFVDNLHPGWVFGA